MKDTVIKGNGKSRSIKAPTDMPATFEEWRTQLLAGTATLDISLNAAGCDVVGTAMSKANLLSDTTKSALELSGSDPTVNDALYALSQKGSPAEVHVMADSGTTVTMSKGGKTLTATAQSNGYAVLIRPSWVTGLSCMFSTVVRRPEFIRWKSSVSCIFTPLWWATL